MNEPHGVLIERRKGRRIYKKSVLDFPTHDEHILIIDSACDQSMIHISSCRVLKKSSIYFHIGGAMQGIESKEALQVCDVAVLITHPYTNEKVVAIVNQCLLITDNDHFESLLQPHQLRSFGTAIDDCSSHHLGVDGKPGKHCIQTPETKIPLLNDGWKSYLAISAPSDNDMAKYVRTELTSPSPYNPTKRMFTRRVSAN